jgi:hypothetical protein
VNNHPGYYAAYVRDPDGASVEAVFHGEKTNINVAKYLDGFRVELIEKSG